MNIKHKAKFFAIKAHNNQIRKGDKKPYIVHPLNVGNILEEYSFDDNVICAGYLHDVVEDTKYTLEDIKKEFNEDIMSLVKGASEKDKSLSWEERKKETIEKTKKLDIRHKAIICADKISNLEDLRILFGIQNKKDFSNFNRGFDSQKWYYTEIYKSLINNENENIEMFGRLKELIDNVFYDKEDNYIQNRIFRHNEEEYNKLKNIHYRKEELYKLKELLKVDPYVIEFTGTPRTGKTTLINNMYDFFKKKGFNVDVIEEFTTSSRYKDEIYPLLKDSEKKVINTEIPKYVLYDLDESINKKSDIIMVDRSLFDRLVWIDRLYNKNGISKEEYVDLYNKYVPLIKKKINIIISTYTDALTSIKRDYQANLSLEERSFLNEANVNEYNRSLKMLEIYANDENINFHLFDTTKKSQREISFEVIDKVLDDIKENYLSRLSDNKKLLKELR